jgi:transcriptional regulator with XRE-family HTH domain
MIRNRRIAAFLLHARETADLTGEQVAAKMRWSSSKLSRIENFRAPVRLEDLTCLLDLYDVRARRRAVVLDLADQILATQPPKSGWRDRPPEDYADAHTVMEWAPVSFPRFLRTPAYATAVLESQRRIFPRPPRTVRALAAEVTGPQARLARGQGMTLRALIGEPALHRLYGDPAVMRDQARRVLDVAAHPNVAVRVLPLYSGDAPGDVPAFIHAQFTGIADAPMPDAVLLGQLAAEPVRFDDDSQTYPHAVAFGQMWEAAADEAATDGLLAAAVDAWGD